MESVDCNLCGPVGVVPVIVGRDRLFYSDERFEVVRCASCALAFLSPRPDREEMGRYYPPEYHAEISREPPSENRMVRIGKAIFLGRRTPELVPGGKLLDIGCSGGGYLVEMRKLGWDVFGVEMDPDMERLGELGLDVRAGAAEVAMAEFPDEHFDVVTAWHVLEHLFDPSRVLREAFRVLKPGGRLMLEVPNFNCPSRTALRTYWAGLDLPRHLYHFAPKTLERLLRKVGFQEVQVRGVPAALALTLSLQLVWSRWTHSRSLKVVSNPILLTMSFPVSWLLAKFRWSSFMTADAVKPTPKNLMMGETPEGFATSG